jgi:diaminopimelate decarboxylase
VVFSGVGKRADEMDRALEAGIRCFNVESAGELERLNDAAAAHGVVAPVSFRVNPDVDAGTHPYISTGLRENKFGIHMEEALSLYLQAAEMENIRITGVDCHIGSQLTRLDPFLDALDRVLALVDRLEREGIAIDHLDLGGGLGVRNTDASPPPPADYARAIHDRLRDMPFELLLEPGRAIAANAGILVTRVEYVKDTPDKHFTVVDAAMNDLLRPSLYQSVQQIIPVTPVPGRDPVISDIVGPVCETGDFLGKDRSIAAVPGELLAVRSSGAYGFTMSSNYNTRPRAAEVMVDGEEVHLVRHRESLASLWEGESILP